MNIRLIASLMVVVLLSAFGLAEKSLAEERQTYTLLIYMNGSDLESEGGAATSDLEEMQQAVIDEGINIIIETGGTKEWQNEDVRSDVNQRWQVTENGLELLETLEPMNMGAPETLQDFLSWGIENFPAENYALSFWNHGGGAVAGFGVDEWFDGDSLVLEEIESAVSGAMDDTGITLDWIGFDSCLMATLEVAALFAPYADYLIASEELEPGHGWNYTPAITALSEDPALSGEEMGRVIADGFMEQAIEQGTSEQITLSVLRLADVNDVLAELESFSVEVDSSLSKHFYEVAYARSTSREYSDTDMVDLVDFASRVADLYPETASALIESIEQAVVYNVTSDSYTDSKGLSIYFPENEAVHEQMSVYETVHFPETYKQFLNNYVSFVATDGESPIEFEEATPNEDSEFLFSMQLSPEDVEKVSTIYSVLAKRDGDELIFLSQDEDVAFDRETGELHDQFTGYGTMLGDQFVSMSLDYADDQYLRYTIPVLLNGEQVTLIVLFDFSNGNEEATAEILGAWPGFVEGSQMAIREMIQLEKGDRVTPLYPTYNEVTGEEGISEGEEIIWDNEMELQEDALPVGEYVYGFTAVDYAGRETYSDFIDLTLTPLEEEWMPWREEIAMVDAYKTWTVTFSQPVSPYRIQEWVYVINEYEELIPVEVTLAEDRRSITVTPLTPYEPDLVYSLRISEQISAANGDPLKQSIERYFTVE